VKGKILDWFHDFWVSRNRIQKVAIVVIGTIVLGSMIQAVFGG